MNTLEHSITIFILIAISTSINAQNRSFITTWKTDNAGASNDQSISIPTNPGLAGNYNYEVDWDNDGKFDESNIIGDISHEFEKPGNYTIRIRGSFPAIYFNNTGDKRKLISIDQWGDIVWKTFDKAFYGCANLIQEGQDIPFLGDVTDMSSMFSGCDKFNSEIDNWDVSNVTNMCSMFAQCNDFNAPLSSWQVGSVTDMSFMFVHTETFNQNIGSWNVSNVETMLGMFHSSDAFNQDISAWQVGSVIDMKLMFAAANLFNQPIGSWDVSNVKDMSFMFRFANDFNQDIGEWDVSNVTDIPQMFRSAQEFNQDLGNWDVSSVTDMEGVFNESGIQNYNYDRILIGWSALPSLQSNALLGAEGLKYCQGGPARSALEDKGWIITGDEMDCYEPGFITTWDTNNPGMSDNHSITIPINSDYIGDYNYDVDWDNDGVFDAIGVTGDTSHYYGDAGIYQIRIQGDFPSFSFIDYAYVEDDELFYGDAIKLIRIEQWGDIEWQTFENAFVGCRELHQADNDRPDLSNVTSMHRMFYDCNSFNGKVGSWDVSTITDMSYMFDLAYSFNRDIGSWDVSNVTNMAGMFIYTRSFNQDIGSWDVSNVTDMNTMFVKNEVFDQDIGSWDVSNVTDMKSMFREGASFNQDITSWDVSSVENLSFMFSEATSFNQDLGAWDISNVVDMAGIFKYCGIRNYNYDNILLGWSVLPNLQSNVSFGALGMTYCYGSDARAILEGLGWNIYGDEQSCDGVCDPGPVNLTWTAASGNNWKQANSWNLGIEPSECFHAIIPLGKTVEVDGLSDVLAHSIEVNSGATFTIKNGGRIEFLSGN